MCPDWEALLVVGIIIWLAWMIGTVIQICADPLFGFSEVHCVVETPPAPAAQSPPLPSDVADHAESQTGGIAP